MEQGATFFRRWLLHESCATVDTGYCSSGPEKEWNRGGVVIPGGVRLDEFAPAIQRAPEPTILFQAVNFVISLGVITLLFALLFRFFPDVHVAWKDVWIGAFLTAVLFTIGKFLIGLYLGNASIGSTYGAAGSLAVFLVWVYISAVLLLYGVEVTAANARLRRHRPEEIPAAPAPRV